MDEMTYQDRLGIQVLEQKREQIPELELLLGCFS